MAGDRSFNWRTGRTWPREHWLPIRSRLLGGNFKLEVIGQTAWGTRLYATTDAGTGERRFFSSLRQALFYANGLEHRGREMGESYAIGRVDFRDGDLVIDCGANYGDLLLYFNHLPSRPTVSYVGVEPGRDEFECLERNLGARSNVRLLNVALGAVDGEQTFYYDPEPANSSLERPAEFIDSYTVTVQTLDSLLTSDEYRDQRVRLLKLEAEGFEPEIVAGARETLSRIDYVAADLGFERGVDSESTAPAVVNTLLESGFQLEGVGAIGSMRLLFKNTSIA